MNRKRAVAIKQFEAELEGCVKGSRIPPELLKEIWGIVHIRDEVLKGTGCKGK